MRFHRALLGAHVRRRSRPSVIPRPVDVAAELLGLDLHLPNTKLNSIAKSDDPLDDPVINDGKMSDTAGDHLLENVPNTIL